MNSELLRVLEIHTLSSVSGTALALDVGDRVGLAVSSPMWKLQFECIRPLLAKFSSTITCEFCTYWL